MDKIILNLEVNETEINITKEEWNSSRDRAYLESLNYYELKFLHSFHKSRDIDELYKKKKFSKFLRKKSGRIR